MLDILRLPRDKYNVHKVMNYFFQTELVKSRLYGILFCYKT